MNTEDIRRDLELNFKEFFESGEEELKKERFNAAVTSFFKAIAVLCDMKIYETRGLLPKNHQERFLFLKLHFREIEELVSSLFKKYTDSYNLRMNRKDATEIKENVKRIKELFEE